MSKASVKSTIPRMGYFLAYRYWKNAIKLLLFQLKVKKGNKHFNTLSMFYYEKLEKQTGRLKKKYFTERVASNLFYGLEDEFSIIPYTIPKSNLGLRKYKFFTIPLRLVYYSVGLYLVELSQEFVNGFYTQYCKNIFSEYGGKLHFHKDTRELSLKYDSIWYKPHYRRFRRRVLRETKDDLDNKVVIHVDIQNYYDELSVSKLLQLLERFIDSSVTKTMRFDAITQDQILAFFDFMSNNGIGIPQSDNDIISSYIGYLYLVFGDLFIDREIRRENDVVNEYKIIRYMDDTYISITFKQGATRFEREKYINSASARIADCYYVELGLRLNTKTQLYWLNNPKEVESLIANLKRVSPGYEPPEDDEAEHPQNKLNRIFRQLRKLKGSPLDPSFNLRRDIDSETLKDIYIKNVNALLLEKTNVERIGSIFTDFNFDLVIAQAREIIIILLANDKSAKAFRKYLLSKKTLTSREAFLILTFLCQTDFKSKKLVNHLRTQHYQFTPIIEKFNLGKIESKAPGYFSLSQRKVLKIVPMHNVIEQIRLRVFAERRQQYSVALNHLLNEVHAICLHLDKRKIPETRYRSPQVLEFLNQLKVPYETSSKISKLFDRRNKNPISHADPIAWPVSESEYFDYYESVGECLSYIL